MVKLLLIGVLAIVVLGGSVTGLTMMGVVPDVLGIGGMLGMPAPTEDEEHAASEAAPPAPPDHELSPTFMRLPQFAIPVITDGRAGRHLNLSLRMHIDPEAKAEIRRAMPRLNDVILTGLVQKLPDLQDRAGRLDGPALKAVLNMLVRREMGTGPVHDVLIDNAYFR